MSIDNRKTADLTPSSRIVPATLSTELPQEAQGLEAAKVDFFAVAASSFQIHLDWIEQQGRKDTPDWHLANGLLRLAQGLQQDREAQEDRLKSFARSSPASDSEAASPAIEKE